MMDENAKKAFLKLPFDEQLLAILDCLTFIRTEIVDIKKRQSDFEEDVRIYRRLRERLEEVEKARNER
jgi:hypothetical protein